MKAMKQQVQAKHYRCLIVSRPDPLDEPSDPGLTTLKQPVA